MTARWASMGRCWAGNLASTKRSHLMGIYGSGVMGNSSTIHGLFRLMSALDTRMIKVIWRGWIWVRSVVLVG